MHSTAQPAPASHRCTAWVWILAGTLVMLAGMGRLVAAESSPTVSVAEPVTALTSGAAASLDSPIFTFSPGWEVTADGADPPEPAEPRAQPSGTVEFNYPGGELALQLATGNYWGYAYVTVDGAPANRLAVIPGNVDSTGRPAGYKPLQEPERSRDGENAVRWVRVHQAPADGQPHAVRIEIWRSWDQQPLRAVGVDVMPPAPWRSAGSLLLALGGLMAGFGLWQAGVATPLLRHAARPEATRPAWAPPFACAAPWLAGAGLLAIATGTLFHQWLLCSAGVGLLMLAGVVRPAFWLGALLFSLPFYFGVKLPLLPARSFDLVDLGVLGGIVVVAAHWFMCRRGGPSASEDADSAEGHGGPRSTQHASLLLLTLLTLWAFAAALDARYPGVALHEWRTVFLNALLFGLTLLGRWQLSDNPGADRRLLVGAWLAGGTAVALVGLWGFAAGGPFVSEAEGVRRIQAFYGSANNLALYLERTVAVALALALFSRGWRTQVAWGLVAAPQLLALLFTFSRGSLVLALPATMIVLLAGGVWLLKHEGRTLRPLLVVLAVAAAGVLLMAPFLGAERFQRLFDFAQGTGFLRLQLWRSAWQMALDYPLFGVGPDHFLYHYRSDYMLPAAWEEPNLNHPHNLLLDWWTRLGVVGLLLGLGWLGTGIAGLVAWLRRGPERALALGLLAAAAAAIAHGMIDVSYALPDLVLVWVFLSGVGWNPKGGRHDER